LPDKTLPTYWFSVGRLITVLEVIRSPTTPLTHKHNTNIASEPDVTRDSSPKAKHFPPGRRECIGYAAKNPR
jgi:hypothetical protein